MQKQADTDRAHLPELLDSVARSLAQAHALTNLTRRSRGAMPAADFATEFDHLFATLASMNEASIDNHPGIELLFENDYVVQQAVRLVGDNTPADGYRDLPVLTTSPYNGQLRVLVLADELLNVCGAPLDLGWVRNFLDAYQEHAELSLGELWALPNLLRFIVLRRLIGVVRTLLAEAAPVSGATPDYGGAIATYLLTLRALTAEDWSAFVESTSLAHRVLSRDPAGAYAAMDRETRNRYRNRVEAIARVTRRPEGEVARQTVALAEGHQPTTTPVEPSVRDSHVGFYLLDEGRQQLIGSLNRRRARIRTLTGVLTARGHWWFLGGIALASVLLLWPVYLWATPGAATALIVMPIALVLALTASVNVANWLAMLIAKPRRLAKMDFRRGIPSEFATVVVIPALLTSAEQVSRLLDRLETNYLGNRDPMISYALLTDFADADEPEIPGDAPLLDLAVRGIEQLNSRHGDADLAPFLLFHRPRKWNPREGCYLAWERKRGKLVEFNRLLLGDRSKQGYLRVGDIDRLAQVRFVITLDADTRLTAGSAERMISTLGHPLNQPVTDPATGTVRAGYSMIQPRLAVDPEAAGRNAFTRAFAGDVVLDIYSRAVSNVYQDLFGVGIFAGKGIYDVRAFEASLADRVPSDAILSHDLFEGLHGRVGLATDIVLLEDYPDNPVAWGRRAHRWIRGDWQLLPWLLPKVPGGSAGRLTNRFSMLDRWKIFDNLRRSLVAPAILMGFAVAWLVLPDSAWIWTLAVLLVALSPVALGSVHALGTGLAQSGTWRAFVDHVRGSLHGEVSRALYLVAFLPYESRINLDAAARACWRLVRRRHLLQWVTAEEATRSIRRSLSPAYLFREMAIAPSTAVVLGGLITLLAPASLLSAWPLLLGWLSAPLIAYRSSRAEKPRWEEQELSPEQRRFARRVALRTWLFFERFVSPENHWLPPDNYHEAPEVFLSRRTSPTNIGFMLLANVAAWDLGYQTVGEVLRRMRYSMDSLLQLDRYRGHLLNWYRLDDLSPLEPRYVSTVDSGNLAASLLLLAEALPEIIDTPLTQETLRAGLEDMLLELAELAAAIEGEADESRMVEELRALIETVRCPPAAHAWPDVLRSIEEQALPDLLASVLDRVRSDPMTPDAEKLSDVRRAFNLLRQHVQACLHECRLLPWLHWPTALDDGEGLEAIGEEWEILVRSLTTAPSIRSHGDTCRRADQALQWMQKTLRETVPPGAADPVVNRLQTFRDELIPPMEEAGDLLRIAQALITEAGALYAAMDFRFLYDPGRHLFRIGYSVTAGEPDPNYYDLLASEARLGSFVAIVKGDVPREHWVHLGRPFTRLGNKRGLVSWSATAFEYLMPHLLMRAPPHTLIGESCRVAIEQQRAFSAAYRLPWGISESGFYQLDKQAHYQYRAFGVPRLGLRLESSYRVVIAPYASALALPFTARDAAANLQQLVALNAFGRLGFFEAVDFGTNPGENGLQRRGRVVRSYMSHHQGMILVALVNAVRDNAFVRRFHGNPGIASFSHLLYEQVPGGTAEPIGWRESGSESRLVPSMQTLEQWKVERQSGVPSVHVLSNEHYQIQMNHMGMSGSFWKGLCLTGWRNDPCDPQGSCIYVKDLDSDALWSAGSRPIPPSDPADCDSYFAPHMAEFHRRDHGINLTLSVVVCRDDVEIHRVSLINDTDRPRRLLLVSYAEPVLAGLPDYQRHPVFSQLFVETSAVPAEGIVIARRRPREETESPVYFGHGVCEFSGRERGRRFLLDRRAFLGRERSAGSPAGLAEQLPDLSGTVQANTSLSPALSIGIELELPPRTTGELAFLSAAARSRGELLRTLRDYQSAPRVSWAFQQAQVYSQGLLAELDLASADVRRGMALYSSICAVPAELRQAQSVESGARQSLLWSRAISGDLPVLLLHVRGFDDVAMAEELVRIHRYWDKLQIAVDLVLLDSEIGGYTQPTRTRLSAILEEAREHWRHYTQGHIHIVPTAELGEEDRNRLLAAAWVVLDPANGSIGQQLAPSGTRRRELPAFVPVPSSPLLPEATPPLARPENLLFDNGLGGFAPDGREYSIFLDPGRTTPAPWGNVISNPEFGFYASSSGAMCTWSGNSGEHRLSPWYNDPLRDPSGESLYVRDEETGAFWSPTPQPRPADAPYHVRHGAGYTIWSHASHGLRQELSAAVDVEDPVKLIRLELANVWQRPRRLTVTCCVEWVLGAQRDQMRPHIATELDRPRNALYARNRFAMDTDRTVFLASSQPIHGFTTDRREFLGLDGDSSRPAGLSRVGLSGELRNDGDPCAVLQVHVDIPAGATTELYFLLGEGADRHAVEALIGRYGNTAEAAASRRRVQDHWDDVLGTLQVETPCPDLDLMVNRWLLYQTISCRLWARSALYQSGGGFGFRDQLQDVMALTASQPGATRDQILRAAAVQFFEGDVLHWWHEDPLRGVRTHCSDDLLWLVLATGHYVRTTGDATILDEPIPYLEAPELAPQERERYSEFRHTSFHEPLYDHCRRALERASGTGVHGLPLIGSGDWNDGLSGLGVEGRGESVWLGWFLVTVYREYAILCEYVGESRVAQHYRERADGLARHIDHVAWDGDWYVRAYDDDGIPLGSAGNDECSIDLNAQSWAVLAGAPSPEHAREAMAAAERHLYRPYDHTGIFRLLAPPFQHTARDPGYIKGYPPGVRENGAQYSHAAVWAGWAYGVSGDGDGALRVFRCVSPVFHAATDRAVGTYQVEPYVVAADIYSVEPLTGRGGWSWYTGAAGWAYRLAVEVILGLERRGDAFAVNPCLPTDWDGYRARWRLAGASYDVRVERGEGASTALFLDGQPLKSALVPIDSSGGDHQVVVRLGEDATSPPGQPDPGA